MGVQQGNLHTLVFLPDTHILQEQSPAHHTNTSPSRALEGNRYVPCRAFWFTPASGQHTEGILPPVGDEGAEEAKVSCVILTLLTR